jgi:hypothetical protein
LGHGLALEFKQRRIAVPKIADQLKRLLLQFGLKVRESVPGGRDEGGVEGHGLAFGGWFLVAASVSTLIHGRPALRPVGDSNWTLFSRASPAARCSMQVQAVLPWLPKAAASLCQNDHACSGDPLGLAPFEPETVGNDDQRAGLFPAVRRR